MALLPKIFFPATFLLVLVIDLVFLNKTYHRHTYEIPFQSVALITIFAYSTPKAPFAITDWICDLTPPPKSSRMSMSMSMSWCNRGQMPCFKSIQSSTPFSERFSMMQLPHLPYLRHPRYPVNSASWRDPSEDLARSEVAQASTQLFFTHLNLV